MLFRPSQARDDATPTQIGRALAAIFGAAGTVWIAATLGAIIPFLIDLQLNEPGFLLANLSSDLKVAQLILFSLNLWLVQISLASLLLWGLLPFLIHFLAFSAMLFNDAPKRPCFIICFITQLLTGTLLAICLRAI